MTLQWMDHGSCVPIGAAAWFGPDGENSQHAGPRIRRNRLTCLGCPVRSECARYAVDTHTAYGVYAGFDLGEAQGRRDIREWLRSRTSNVVHIASRRPVDPVSLSDHPEAVKARNRQARIEDARRNAAAEASA